MFNYYRAHAEYNQEILLQFKIDINNKPLPTEREDITSFRSFAKITHSLSPSSSKKER
jgi:hypothetical protein